MGADTVGPWRRNAPHSPASCERNPSKAEHIVWSFLRNRQMHGAKFRRQHPIGRYFADFACSARRLVIEIDGDLHALQVERDAQRDADMQRLGWRVVRFSATDVVVNPDGVWDSLDRLLKDHDKA